MTSGRALAAAALASLLAIPACGDSDATNPITPGVSSPSSQFTGTFLSGYEAGILSVSIATADLASALRSPGATDTLVAAFGTLSLEGGAVVNATGTYDTTKDSLHLASQTWTLEGLYYPTTTPAILSGSYAGPSGSGFFACWQGNTTSVSVFCGRFESSSSPAKGRWNVAILGATMLGFMAPDAASDVVGFSGMVAGSGTSRAISFSSGWTAPLLTGDGTWNTATNRVDGTWVYGADSGIWGGERCLAGSTDSN